MNRQTLGILGGMGPRSTSPFLEMVLDEVQAQWQPDGEFDYPPIMVLSLPAPMFLGKPLDHDAVSAAIIGGLQRLQAAGIQHIAMPCNTAHLYYDQLANALDVPLLNMVDLAVASLPDSAGDVAILATDWTINASVYQNALAKRGLGWVLKDAWQQGVDNAIEAVKDGGDLSSAKQAWQALLCDIRDAGVTHALLACTDLNPLHEGDPPGLTICDATATLAAEAVSRLEKPVLLPH